MRPVLSPGPRAPHAVLSNSSDPSHSQESDVGRLYGMGRKGLRAEGKGSSVRRTGSLESVGSLEDLLEEKRRQGGQFYL